MRQEEFYFDSRDQGSKIHAVRWIPDTDKPVCIVQIIHGMAEYVDRYAGFAEFLTGKGILVTAEDHLGHGKSVGPDGKYGYFCKKDPATVISLKILYSSLQSFLKHILSQFVPPESLLSFLVLPRERFLFHLLSGSSSAASPVL